MGTEPQVDWIVLIVAEQIVRGKYSFRVRLKSKERLPTIRKV